MRIFITGGAGFIGSHLTKELNLLGHSPIIYDNLSSGKLTNLQNLSYTFINGDIRDREFLTESIRGSEYIFHLAALTSVAESMKIPIDYIETNSFGIVNVLDAAVKAGIKKVVFASSAAVYGDSPLLPKKEDFLPDPKSPYAITKLDGEYYCKLYNDNFGVETACARFFNVFGERQDPNSAYAAAIPIFIKNAISGKPLTIFGDGTQTRDFVYVKDVAKALFFLMKNGNGTFNVGYGLKITINDLIQTIKEKIDSRSEIKYIEERPGEIKHSYASIEKLKSLGFKPDFSIDQGLDKTVEYFKRTDLFF